MRRVLTAIALAVISPMPVQADPISDVLDAVFKPQAQMLGSRRMKITRLHPQRVAVPEIGTGRVMVASYYGGGEKLNAHTSNGERFSPGGMTAAHRSLPFGTRLQVCYRGCVIVRVNDRGPAAWTGRSLDLARRPAGLIGLTGPGHAPVRVARMD